MLCVWNNFDVLAMRAELKMIIIISANWLFKIHDFFFDLRAALQKRKLENRTLNIHFALLRSVRVKNCILLDQCWIITRRELRKPRRDFWHVLRAHKSPHKSCSATLLATVFYVTRSTWIEVYFCFEYFEIEREREIINSRQKKPDRKDL